MVESEAEASRPWVRRSTRDGHLSEEVGPFDGVPSWLRHSLAAWVAEMHRDFAAESQAAMESGDFDPCYHSGRLAAVVRRLRFEHDVSERDERLIYQLEQMSADDDFLLDWIDALLPETSKAEAALLGQLLLEGGSIWTVTDCPVDGYENRHWLQRRIAPGVVAALDLATEARGAAASHLASARLAAYGRSPDPSKAFAEAVKAAEAAVCPIVSPTDQLGTLGKALKVLVDQRAKWTVVLAPSGNLDPVMVVTDMCGLLWRSHRDRHGTLLPEVITQPEAEAAIVLALAIVTFFESQWIHRLTRPT